MSHEEGKPLKCKGFPFFVIREYYFCLHFTGHHIFLCANNEKRSIIVRDLDEGEKDINDLFTAIDILQCNDRDCHAAGSG